MTPPPIFDRLLRRSLPDAPAGDPIRGDLLEELAMSGNSRRARLRFRAQVLSIVLRYGVHRQGTAGEEPRVPAVGSAKAGRQRQTMDAITQELKFAIRSLVKRPSFALMVVATLALGIGANTAIFSLLHALVLRSLPVSDPQRLVVVTRNQLSLQYPLFRHFSQHNTTLEGLMAFRTHAFRFSTAERTERINGALVSGSYFGVLGVTPALGTLIGEADDVIPDGGGSRGAIAVLSHGFWQRQYGGRTDAVGSTIILNARPFTIVGVTPAGFDGTEVGETSIVALVMREAGSVLGAGIATGLVAAWALGRAVESLLYGVEPTDALSISIAVLVLGCAGALAAWIPARRASRVEPIQALRYE